MSKRTAEDGGNGNSSQPPIKKVHFEPHLIGPVSTLEEMDIKVLQFQNKKLAQRIEQRHRCEAELRARIEQLEKRQTQDDAVLCVVNRYWNLLNEDIRVLLQRFDAETADESENKNENEATTSFLMQLSTWDKEELDAQLANRVQVSKRAVAKVLQAFDRLQQRNDKIWKAIKGEGEEGAPAPSLDEVIRATNEEVTAENRRLQALSTTLHENHHAMTLRVAQLQDAVNSRDTENAELKNQIDDLQYELMKVRSRNDKLENHLAEAIEKLKSYHQSGTAAGNAAGPACPAPHPVVNAKLEDVAAELEEQRELATNRLAELDRLHRQHRDTLKELEKLKMDIRQLPESVIVETTEYKCLQSQFSVLYNESMQMKTALDETRLQLQNAKNLHMRQIEMMESEELARQKALRAEMIQLEDVLGQLRKEYEMLRIEFEQNLAANEQTGPINREMRHLITSLQNHNQQLKGEVHRYKRKYKDTSQELNKIRKEMEEANARGGASTEQPDEKPLVVKKEEPDPEGEEGGSAAHENKGANKEHNRAKLQEQDQIIKDLKQQLKKAVNEQKELKLLLDMYKGVSKEQRDKVQLMAAERKARQELEDHRQKAKMAQESKRERRLADEDALRKIKQLEEQKYELQKQLSCARPNADPLHTFARPFAGSQARGRSSPQRDGSDGAGVRGHAGAELAADPAAAGEGRRQLQTHVREDQGQLAPQAAARRETTAAGTGGDAGPADRVDGAGGAAAGGEGAAAAEHAVGRGEGAAASPAGHGDAQAEGHRVRAVRRRPQAASGKVPRANEGSATGGRRKNERARSGGVQDQAAARGAGGAAAQGGAHEEDGAGRQQHGRGAAGGDPRVQGDAHLSLVQGETQGRGAHKVFPRVLLGLPAHALRDAPAQVPQVQRGLRRQRLPPPLPLHLSAAATELTDLN